MAGISSTLSIAKTAIATQQYGLSVTGQNIANVNNPNYSVQNADQKSRKPAAYAGFLFGTGVDINQVEQSVDKLLEARLVGEQSTQASFEEQESYMRILEGFFDESSETSLTSVLTEFWNAWHDISDNPQGSAERVTIFENGSKLASRVQTTVLDMDTLLGDISSDISAAVQQVNSLTKKIAGLNQEILSSEINRTANDLRDQQTALIKELGQLIDITTIEQGNGGILINAANGFGLVNGVDSYNLGMSGKDVTWQSSSGANQIISDRISGGKIGGLMEMRDSVIPKYQAEVNELAREMIWAINYQHSQGTGLEYMNEPVTGDYQTDDSGWLTSFEFGDKIDNTKDFTMWVEDKTDASTQYRKIMVDMGASDAKITNWQGTAPGASQARYELTVVDDAMLGDLEVTESDGDGLAKIVPDTTTGGVAVALNTAIAEQTLTIYNGASGTSVIDVKDAGGEAKRSAASIAEALNKVDGVTAYASETSASVQLVDAANATLLPATQDGDEVQYSIYVDGILQKQSFVRDSSIGTLEEQFKNSLLAGVEAVNQINEDKDLNASGLTLTSSSGKTLGIQDFEVKDNAGIRFNGFSDFNTGDKVTFSIDSMNPLPLTTAAGTTQVTVDLTNVDTTDEAQLSLAFSTAMTTALDGKDFTVKHDPSTNSVMVRTTDGTGVRLYNGANDDGDNAVIDISVLGGTSTATAVTEFHFDNNPAGPTDTIRYDAIALSTDQVAFVSNRIGELINETTNGAGNKSAVIAGTVSATMEPGMFIRSTVGGVGAGGLFSTLQSKPGSSILTLGGEDGFSGFNSTGGETISFTIDNSPLITINTTAATSTSDVDLAILYRNEIDNALGTDYQVIRTGSSVSIIKDAALEDPIKIENFADNSATKATINVRTGTGKGTNKPQNDVLDANPAKAFKNSTTSTLYDDTGVIRWERLDSNGFSTGASGFVSMEDEGQVTIMENNIATLTFDISKGSLVAGNTLTINTDTKGQPDPIDFNITGRANSINELYRFKVVSGGKVGHLPAEGDEPLVIEWSNSVKSGTFTIEGNDPPYTPLSPVEVTVDGMNFQFTDGTVFTDDVFTVTTGETGIPLSLDSTGNPTGETLTDWHWTLDSFTEQFNRQAPGMTASTTMDNRLSFAASDSYYAMDNIQYSGANGFAEDNVTLTVTDWSSVDFAATDLRFEKSGASGVWGVSNDPTGGNLQLMPLGGDDDGFSVDFNGDGVADMRIDFNERVTGNGSVEFDFTQRSSTDIGFAFSDSEASDAGLAAAAGINTFFEGRDALTMSINTELSDTKRIGAAKINSTTGAISKGDNANALSMADVQFIEKTLKIWTYERGREAKSSTTDATLDNYFNTIISSLGIESRSIKNSKIFSDTMVNNITTQRDAVSAVSLDEEMVQLMRYQHAFSAASKLLTVSDEMLNTLISIR